MLLRDLHMKTHDLSKHEHNGCEVQVTQRGTVRLVPEIGILAQSLQEWKK